MRSGNAPPRGKQAILSKLINPVIYWDNPVNHRDNPVSYSVNPLGVLFAWNNFVSGLMRTALNHSKVYQSHEIIIFDHVLKWPSSSWWWSSLLAHPPSHPLPPPLPMTDYLMERIECRCYAGGQMTGGEARIEELMSLSWHTVISWCCDQPRYVNQPNGLSQKWSVSLIWVMDSRWNGSSDSTVNHLH